MSSNDRKHQTQKHFYPRTNHSEEKEKTVTCGLNRDYKEQMKIRELKIQDKIMQMVNEKRVTKQDLLDMHLMKRKESHFAKQNSLLSSSPVIN